MSVIVDGTSGLIFNDASTQTTAATGFGFKNRIINGDMRIDQRNAGTSITPANAQYSVDRWQAWLNVSSKFNVQQNAGSVTPPEGFVNYMGITSSSAYSIGASEFCAMRQAIEGFNTADLAWGTANAKSVTLSFQVRSSLTGTFGGSVLNQDGTRSYTFTYNITSANTWTTVSLTIPGDTAGTWNTGNTVGVYVSFALGAGSNWTGTAGSWAGSLRISATGATSLVGTNGATFYITGVQFEKGSTATSFDYRSFGHEYNLCARYFFSSYPYGTVAGTSNENIAIYGIGVNNQFIGGMSFPTMMRVVPTVIGYHPNTGASGQFGNYADTSTAYTISGTRATDKAFTNFLSSSAVASGAGLRVSITASAEL